MLGLLAPAAIALVTALVAGGSLRGLIDSRFRAWPAVGLAFAVELALYNPPLDREGWAMAIGPWIWIVTRLVMVAVLVVNGWSGSRTAWAWRLAALGVVLNTLVIGLNGGHMPQAPEAAVAAMGGSPIDASRLQNISAMGPDTRLGWLGDVYAEPAWLPRRNVVSVGDMLLASGAALWVYGSVASGRQTCRGLVGSKK